MRWSVDRSSQGDPRTLTSDTKFDYTRLDAETAPDPSGIAAIFTMKIRWGG
jgi:hypothetical protein